MFRCTKKPSRSFRCNYLMVGYLPWPAAGLLLGRAIVAIAIEWSSSSACTKNCWTERNERVITDFRAGMDGFSQPSHSSDRLFIPSTVNQFRDHPSINLGHPRSMNRRGISFNGQRNFLIRIAHFMSSPHRKHDNYLHRLTQIVIRKDGHINIWWRIIYPTLD